MKNTFYTLEKDLKKRLKNPEFKKFWAESEAEYKLASEMIRRRLDKKMSQRDLAKKIKTTQAVISRIETMRANPSLAILKKIAQALDVKLSLNFQ